MRFPSTTGARNSAQNDAEQAVFGPLVGNGAAEDARLKRADEYLPRLLISRKIPVSRPRTGLSRLPAGPQRLYSAPFQSSPMTTCFARKAGGRSAKEILPCRTRR